MVNIYKSLIASGTFLIGYGYTALSQFIYPPLLTTLPLGDTLEGLVWFGIILTWALTMIIIPVGFWYYGLTESSGIDNPVFKATLGGLWFIMGLAFTYFTYSWTTPLTASYTATYPNIQIILTALFWIGLILTWVANIIVIPAKLIIESKGG